MKGKTCNDSHDEFTEAVNRVQSIKPIRPESKKFTYYDERGVQLYRLFSDINMLIVTLHDEVRNNVFSDIDYYQVVGLMPIWLRDAGHSQESSMTRIFFEKMVRANNNYLVNKFLYYHDCEMLVDALQNRFSTVEDMLIQVYDILTPVLKHKPSEYDNIIFTIDEDSQRANAYINSIFINLASSCDIMTKIAVELSGMEKVDFSKYPKMLSANTKYGNYTQLPEAIKQDGTYFAKKRPVVVSKVETVRDEIIHNGSLDFHPMLYYGVNGDEVECWVLAPAFNDNGNFETFQGRKKFYNDTQRIWNNELPAILRDFLTIAQATLQLLLEKFSKKYYQNREDIITYHKEIIGLSSSFVKIAEKLETIVG